MVGEGIESFPLDNSSRQLPIVHSPAAESIRLAIPRANPFSLAASLYLVIAIPHLLYWKVPWGRFLRMLVAFILRRMNEVAQR
jgi:hypothetical protein